ncbi:MAG: ATP-binding protein [Euryarchaeota archaeon]|nr:ATP-binding protein [Euryarchaeota archaeon]
MDKDAVAGLIRDFEDRPLPALVRRELEPGRMPPGKALTVIGPRRAGKTYFLFDLMTRLGVPRKEMLYINLEDDRFLPAKAADIDLVLSTYYQMHPEMTDRTMHLFLDEVQAVDGWELFVRRVLDSGRAQVYLTGSSSRLLSREVATSMRGRAATRVVLPFSFGEFLSARGFTPGRHLSTKERSWLVKHLDDFVRTGGFPEVVLDSDPLSRLRTLRDYVEVVLMRDMVERHRIRETKALRVLFASMLASYAKEFSIHKLYQFFRSQGIRAGKSSLYEMVQHLEDAFSVIPVRRLGGSIRESEGTLPKMYIIDAGYIAQSGRADSTSLGRLMENAVAVELFRRGSADPLARIHYWKNAAGREVDFVVSRSGSVRELVQVCLRTEDAGTDRREVEALLAAGSALRCKALRIITWDHEEKKRVEDRAVEYIPLWKWLLRR